MATLDGGKELAAKLRALKAGTRGRILKDAVARAMVETLNDATNAAPVGTKSHKTYKGNIVEPGYARDSLRLKTWVSKDKESAAAMVGVRPEAYYALQFVELGTSKMPPRPWLEPAFQGNKAASIARIAAELKARIERIARRKRPK